MEFDQISLLVATALFLGTSSILVAQSIRSSRSPQRPTLQLVQSLVDSWLARFTALERRTARNDSAIQEAMLKQGASMRLIRTNEQHLKELANLLSASIHVQTGLLDRLLKDRGISHASTNASPASPPVPVSGLRKPHSAPTPAAFDGLLYLTATGAEVIELMYKGGPMPASRIKDYIHRSREHTARLMKELFEQGYVTRETHKLPYRYKLSNRLTDLLCRDPNAFEKLKLSYREGEREERIASSPQNRPD